MGTESKTITMKYTKSTKSTDVYQSNDQEPQPISTLYIYKWFSQAAPTVTITLSKP